MQGDQGPAETTPSNQPRQASQAANTAQGACTATQANYPLPKMIGAAARGPRYPPPGRGWLEGKNVRRLGRYRHYTLTQSLHPVRLMLS